ncbi:MAG TPA: hypothetical protein V6D07_18815 [Trichocoleus sp.]
MAEVKEFFLDTEFIDSPNKIDLISIGVIDEGGREFYAISTEFNPRKASPWVKENVLVPDPHVRDLWSFQPDYKVHFYGYYADYDWVAFCQLFGKMIDLPRGFPNYCRDIKQRSDSLGDGWLPPQVGDGHQALDDARYVRRCHYFLNNVERERSQSA